ncbi:MAG: SCP2 sterol-binding domain-containing protein [Bacteroidia bacterium]|nr:SCP2 sterol-binding domain-containing protein [Bacteroidia bacterium]
MHKPHTAKDIILSLRERFKKDKCEEVNYETVIHFNIEGNQGGQFTVIIQDYDITIEEGLSGNPKCVIHTKDKVYEDVEWGRENGQTAFLFGKIKVNNIPEILQFSGVFHSVKRFYEDKHHNS